MVKLIKRFKNLDMSYHLPADDMYKLQAGEAKRIAIEFAKYWESAQDLRQQLAKRETIEDYFNKFIEENYGK